MNIWQKIELILLLIAVTLALIFFESYLHEKDKRVKAEMEKSSLEESLRQSEKAKAAADERMRELTESMMSLSEQAEKKEDDLNRAIAKASKGTGSCLNSRVPDDVLDRLHQH